MKDFTSTLNDLKMLSIEEKEERSQLLGKIKNMLNSIAEASEDMDCRILAKWGGLDIVMQDGTCQGSYDLYILSGYSKIFFMQETDEYYTSTCQILRTYDVRDYFEHYSLEFLRDTLTRIMNITV